MEFNIQKKISNFVESQFPQFYLEEGQNFVEFVKAYYEWLENEGSTTIDAGAINQARNLLDYRDIDNTLDKFLEHFQQKYLYGIPFNTITDRRLLLKHVLDVYRSKGSIQCYKLLFRLLYNEDCEIYLPGNDVLRVSDGTWVQPRYIEVVDTGDLARYQGKTIYGTSTRTEAIVESIVTEPINNKITTIMYISNISPKGSSFIPGEKIVIQRDLSVQSVQAATTIIGSLNRLEITSGGQGFKVGDILRLVHNDVDTNEVISNGIGGEVRVTGTSRGVGALNFRIINGGGGYIRTSNIFFYKADSDTTGLYGSFKLGPLSYSKRVTYNTDLIMDHLNFANGSPITLNSAQFLWASNPSANIGNTIATVLSFSTNTFGTITSLSDINPGNNYTSAPSIFVYSTMRSNTLNGTVTYKTNSKIVSSTNTNITTLFPNNRPIYLQANDTLASSNDNIIVKQSPYVANVTANTLGFSSGSDTIIIADANTKFTLNDQVYYSVPTGNTPIDPLTGNTTYYVSFANSTTIKLATTSGGANIDITDARTTVNPGEVHSLLNNNKILLYQAPTSNSTASATYRYCAPIFPANFANNESLMYRNDGTVNGLNANIIANPATGNDIISSVTAYNSGKGYLDGENVVGYLFNSMTVPLIEDGGTGYANNDTLVFSGGGASTDAEGFVTTDNAGVITTITLSYNGSGYQDIPYLAVKSTSGNGAILKPSIAPANSFNTYSAVRGTVVRDGVGVAPGYWSTTRGFLNSDKYIQDSYFYQDFSYQVRTALTLEQYKNILYDTFHVAGSQLFGEYYKVTFEADSPMIILYDQNRADTGDLVTNIAVDTTFISSDVEFITSDEN